MEVNWKKGEFEVRTTRDIKGEPKAELVKWDTTQAGKEYCFVLAYFHRDSDGYYNLIFVGDRPFRYLADIDIADIWRELFMTQLMLNGDKPDEM